jgi:hypothetical protein
MQDEYEYEQTEPAEAFAASPEPQPLALIGMDAGRLQRASKLQTLLMLSRAMQLPGRQRDNSPNGRPAPTGDYVYDAGRNDPCPCGSGKRFKRCHYGQRK